MDPIQTTLKPAELASLRQAVVLIRGHLRDYEELNRLVSGERHSDRSIAVAVLFAMDQVVTTPPLITAALTLTTVPANLLITGAVAWLLRSDVTFSVDNRLTYQSSNGSAASVTDSLGPKQALYSALQQEFTAKVTQWKMAINLNSALAGGYVQSEYATLAAGLYNGGFP